MDRHGGGTLETRRSSNQLLVDKLGRKPLFGSANSGDGNARNSEASQQPRPPGSGRYQPPIDGLTHRARSDGPAPASAQRNGFHTAGQTPGGSRLPQAKGSSVSARRPLTMSEAFKLAEQEEGAFGGEDGPMDGSPSPAPRSWRSRFNNQMKATEAGRELAKVTRGDLPGANDSNPQPTTRPSDDQFDFGDGELAIPPLVPGIEDSPFSSPIREGLGSPMRRHSTTTSPQKSFAWDIDQDFTAGDLQVSDSPRIRVDDRPFANRRVFDDNSEIDLQSPTRLNPPGSRNTKLDEILALERRAGDVHSFVLPSPRRNTKLDDIAALEASAQSHIPIPDRKLSTPKNSKLSEIHQRELEGLSKRQLASLRLGEIREQNAMARSAPDTDRLLFSKDSLRDSKAESKTDSDRFSRPKSAYEAARETGSNPIATFKSRQKTGREISRSLDDKDWRSSVGRVRPTESHSRKSSNDVSGQAARGTAISPALRRTASNTTSEKTSDSSETKSRFAKRAAARNGRKQNKDNRDGDNKRLTVGFTGLKRVQSTESTNSKRSSMHSEPDPTERLEAELKLFAPTDNHSEPGSVRAQSPASDSDDEKMAEATPKPKRQDPLLMPTPRVTGAYVETPATVRVEKVVPQGEETKRESTSGDEALDLLIRPTRVSLGDRRRSSSWSSADRYPSSDPGAAETQSADETSAAVKKPRAKLPRRQRPPIRNSAKLPSVKDDLLELHRLHNVEDSTLDDLEQILTGQKQPADTKEEGILQEQQEKDPEKTEAVSEDEKPATSLEPEPQHKSTIPKSIKVESPDVDDLAAYDRMSKSLHTVSLGIRDAKKGIESLEDRFTSSQSEKSPTMAPETHTHDHDHSPACVARPEASALAYIHVPVPRLYQHTPTFRFTLAGLLVLMVSIWYATETAMCAKFCRPTSCDPTTGPCVWSFDDPTSFGTALPIKVDQWITRGYGRKRFGELYEILDDAKADLIDAALGRHITEVDVNSLFTPEQRRQHRRRLRKKGLLKRKYADAATPEDRAKWAAWHQARLESEKAKEAREMGYAWDDEGEGSVGGDVPMDRW